MRLRRCWATSSDTRTMMSRTGSLACLPTKTPTSLALSRVGFCHGERHRGGAGAAWGGVGALVAARRASWRVGPSIPHGRPQGPLPHIHATPAPPRGGISAPQKPTPERGDHPEHSLLVIYHHK